MNKKPKPMTGIEFYDKVSKILEGQGKLDMLDYAMPFYQKELTCIEFDIVCETTFGGNEGIYNTFYLLDRDGRQRFATMKTLYAGEENFRKMAMLGCDLILEARRYVEQHDEEFDFHGFTVYLDDKPWLECSTLERAKERAAKVEGRETKIRDNYNRIFV